MPHWKILLQDRLKTRQPAQQPIQPTDTWACPDLCSKTQLPHPPTQSGEILPTSKLSALLYDESSAWMSCHGLAKERGLPFSCQGFFGDILELAQTLATQVLFPFD